MCGKQSADQEFWHEFRDAIINASFRENKIAKALYFIAEEDDQPQSAESEYAVCEDKNLKEITVSTREHDIREHDTWTINFIMCNLNGREPVESAEMSEIGQMRSMIGYLGWIT
eukprot:12417334-Karenia_brevis.AAC.1